MLVCTHVPNLVRFQVMIDDYVLPSEPVVDFKTRFSGLVADDLDPYASRHHLVSKQSNRESVKRERETRE